MDSRSSLGVVIPCHKPYIPYLKECLDSIEAQTDKPDAVVVICSSSCPEDIPPEYRQYSFPLEIVTREGVFNQAQNRNEGVRHLQTDLVSFFDADDIMHPQRIELIRTHIRDGGILLHAYQSESRDFPQIGITVIHWDALMRGPAGCVVHRIEPNRLIHHSQGTVRRGLLNVVSFSEAHEDWGREDSLFCGNVVALQGVRNVYIAASLSWYRPHAPVTEYLRK